MTLTEFLLARIAEDEAEAADPYWGTTDGLTTSDRLLAECEAKRLRLAIADTLEAEADGDTYRWAHSIAEQIRKTDALPFADHPDYRPEWKP